MKKLLIFHPALAPYRIDYFNFLSDLFEVKILFIYDNVWNHKFDQEKLLSQLKCSYSFLLKGPEFKGRVFRFGMLKAIRDFKPEFIISYEYSFTTQYLIMLKRLGIINQTLGSTIDDSIQICDEVQSKLRFLARSFSVKKLDFIIVLSKDVSDYYNRKFNLSKSRIVVFPILQLPERLRVNSSSLEQIAEKYASEYDLLGKKVLLFVGRFIEPKGLPLFIKTISSLLSNDENLRLVLIGEGDVKGEILSIIKNYQLQSKVILPGRFEGDELLAWYLCASGFILPSTYEPFGAVVNEALIFGLPVFCSKYAGSASLLEYDMGELFDPIDANDVIERLQIFLSNVNILETLLLSSKPSKIVFRRDFIEEELKKIVSS
ncbi:glycosyltransferase [Flavobacterium sp. LHD-80]|uniref:glycosyltransferase n=1 Tax=Flavobacterium sp. LHD-80 TaxID=3071411 RepID=UPI0027E0FC67|nr:glycosyltransferase [Flavobacterium sp. LHD-80]MDQ6471030.1 glycosyltransferase [Flavobacterium sp. LHD-80]